MKIYEISEKFLGNKKMTREVTILKRQKLRSSHQKLLTRGKYLTSYYLLTKETKKVRFERVRESILELVGSENVDLFPHNTSTLSTMFFLLESTMMTNQQRK